MDNKIIVSRIRFNERVAIITITDSSTEEKRVATKIMRRIANQETKKNRPIMYVKMNKNDANLLFSSNSSKVIKV